MVSVGAAIVPGTCVADPPAGPFDQRFTLACAGWGGDALLFAFFAGRPGGDTDNRFRPLVPPQVPARCARRTPG
jgi:hypothetical protein